MSELKIDAGLDGLNEDVVELSETAESMGFDGVWTPETQHDAFLGLPIVANNTERLRMGTRIALSFTRSPMVLAYIGWDLARFSDGRFILGLGTQVKGHNERRFSVEWKSPGPRLREVVESLRHIWNVFQGEEDELDYEGQFYSFSLMTDFFNPGPIEHPDIPIHIAGVNEYNLRLAGELCDGLCVHSFNTPEYLEEVVLERVSEGARNGDRSLEDVTISASPFVITGRNDDEMNESRENVRRRIAFYGSTRTYMDVFAHHGWEETGKKLHRKSVRNEWDEMPDLITDEMLHHFAIEAPLETIAREVKETYEDLVDRVQLSLEYEGEGYWRDIVSDMHEST